MTPFLCKLVPKLVTNFDHAQNQKKQFFSEITKADHQLSETFYLIKILYTVLMSYEYFSILTWVMFFVNRVSDFVKKSVQWRCLSNPVFGK